MYKPLKLPDFFLCHSYQEHAHSKVDSSFHKSPLPTGSELKAKLNVLRIFEVCVTKGQEMEKNNLLD